MFLPKPMAKRCADAITSSASAVRLQRTTTKGRSGHADMIAIFRLHTAHLAAVFVLDFFCPCVSEMACLQSNAGKCLPWWPS